MLKVYKKIDGLALSVTLATIIVIFSSVTQANSRDVNLVQESQKFLSGNKVAVVVGVNNYTKYSGLKTLKYAAADANVIGSVLKNKHGYTVRGLPNHEGNKDNILTAIADAGALLKNKQGTLVFFFSGHGFVHNGENYLAPSNFNSRRVSQSGLTIREVEDAIKKTGVRRAILLIDACRDDPRIEGNKSFGSKGFRQQYSSGVQHLFGAEFGKQSWEHQDLKHGVFSYYLHKGLDGAAQEKSGIISFDSLKSYVQENVLKWSFKNLPVPQKPHHSGEAYGVFVLGRDFVTPSSVNDVAKTEKELLNSLIDLCKVANQRSVNVYDALWHLQGLRKKGQECMNEAEFRQHSTATLDRGLKSYFDTLGMDFIRSRMKLPSHSKVRQWGDILFSATEPSAAEKKSLNDFCMIQMSLGETYYMPLREFRLKLGKGLVSSNPNAALQYRWGIVKYEDSSCKTY